MPYNSALTGAQIDEAVLTTIPSLQSTLNELYGGKVLSNATVDSVSTMFTFRKRATSPNIPAAGMGQRFLWTLDSSTTQDRSAAQMDVLWVDAADATYTARLSLSVSDKAALGGTEFIFDHVTVPSGDGNGRNPALGIGTIPNRALHVKFSTPAQTTISIFENANSTDENGIVQSFRSTTTGTGGVANTELAGFRTLFTVHNHATRTAHFEFFVVNSGSYEVFKFRPGNLFGYGGLSLASFTQLLGPRKTGWAVATGTATRTTFDTTTVTTAQLAERLKALIDDLHSTAGHGLIGS